MQREWGGWHRLQTDRLAVTRRSVATWTKISIATISIAQTEQADVLHDVCSLLDVSRTSDQAAPIIGLSTTFNLVFATHAALDPP